MTGVSSAQKKSHIFGRVCCFWHAERCTEIRWIFKKIGELMHPHVVLNRAKFECRRPKTLCSTSMGVRQSREKDPGRGLTPTVTLTLTRVIMTSTEPSKFHQRLTTQMCCTHFLGFLFHFFGYQGTIIVWKGNGTATQETIYIEIHTKASVTLSLC